MTKEEAIIQVMDERHDSFMNTDSVDFFDGYATTVFKAMDAWAKQQALLFQKYLSRYKQEEHVRTQRMYEKAGGIVSHRSASIEDIYNDFIELRPIPSESMDGIIYYFNTGVETSNFDQYISEKRQSKQ